MRFGILLLALALLVGQAACTAAPESPGAGLSPPGAGMNRSGGGGMGGMGGGGGGSY
jgi:hypothetical protein